MLDKLKWVLLLACIAALAWWGGGKYLTQKVEAQMQETLKKMGIADKVQWQSLSASPLGIATVNHIRFELEPLEYIDVQQMIISDVIKKPSQQRSKVQFKQVKLTLSPKYLQDAPESLANPADLTVQTDFNFTQNKGKIIYAVEQEGFADIELELNLSQISGLRPVFDMLESDSENTLDIAELNNRLIALQNLSISSLETKIKNRGLAKHIVQGLKNSINPSVNPSQHEEVFKDLVQEYQSGCHNGDDALRAPCQNLIDFMLEKKPNLHLTANPAQPVSLERLGRISDLPTTLKLLNINLN